MQFPHQDTQQVPVCVPNKDLNKKFLAYLVIDVLVVQLYTYRIAEEDLASLDI